MLRMYKNSILKNDQQKANSSNFIYILFVPIVLYITYIFYNNQSNNTYQFVDFSKLRNQSNGIKPPSIRSDNLLSNSYPNSATTTSLSSD
jgi:hypothetical protein